MRKLIKLTMMAAAGWLACGAGSIARAAAPPPPTKEGIEFFETKIRPVLVKYCYECHSEQAKKIKGKLRVDTYDGILKGGEVGPAVVPGDPGKSWLLISMTYKDKDTSDRDALLMPPKKNGKSQKLPDSVIKDFEEWIKMGAPYPQGGAVKSDAAPRDPREHWAFVAPQEPAIPQVKNESWVKNEIDRFVLARQEEKNLHPSNPADKRALIRRATFDLIGLPPTPQEVTAFETDSSPDAFAKVIDRLLASPRYGERWGRYWLDVARYSDTKGYVFEEERRYPYSYTYRDWVIRALNEDLPYDQFLIDQIAADRIDRGGDDRALAAEGFLTLGRRFLNNLPDIIDDRIDVVCRGTMGLTVGCARCHDHKFDPIPQKDYYALYAVFNNSPEAKDLPLIEKPRRTPEVEQFEKELAQKEAEVESYKQARLEEHRKLLRSAEKIADYLMAAQFQGTAQQPKEAQNSKRTEWMIRRWKDYLGQQAAAADTVFGAWRAYAAVPPDEFSAKTDEVTKQLLSAPINPLVIEAFTTAPASMREVADRYGQLLASSDGPEPNWDVLKEPLRQVLRADNSPTNIKPDDLRHVLTVEEGQHVRGLARAVEAFKATNPASPPRAMALQEAPGMSEQHVFLRGNPANTGALVKPAFLTILSDGQNKPFVEGSGRLELARAIASKDNPLTARVMVNRVWIHHFGKGLVRTPSDFGLRSDPPTHPQLLDFLALRFMDNGWSIKKLHRLIMLSATYQQGSEADASVEKLDPDNTLLTHMNRRRLDWEATRDSLLFVTGKLDTTMGGRAVDITAAPFSARRTVYGFIDRQNLPGVFRAFDFASPDATSPQRFTTTVPQQAHFLMNSPFAVEQAEHLVQRPEFAGEQDAARRVGELYRLAYQRDPSPDETSLALQFINSEEAAAPKHEIAWQYGYGSFDEATQRTVGFRPLPHFTGQAWQGGPARPDPKLGWVVLTAVGGHAGNDQQHAAVRRWVSPIDGVITISGTVSHESTNGDGIRARIVSSRSGELARWNVHHLSAATNLEGIEVKKGDSIDFMVDCRESVEYDSFEWAPTIKVVAPAVAGNAGPAEWNAAAQFAGPLPKRLGAWEKYAQVLLESNEFVFVD